MQANARLAGKNLACKQENLLAQPLRLKAPFGAVPMVGMTFKSARDKSWGWYLTRSN
jgi:hypothetical protein